MGSCPEFYPLIKAARYLGVPAWELAAQPKVWMQWALVSEAAENEAEVERAKRKK